MFVEHRLNVQSYSANSKENFEKAHQNGTVLGTFVTFLEFQNGIASGVGTVIRYLLYEQLWNFHETKNLDFIKESS